MDKSSIKNKNRVVAIIEARMTSTRLPGKVLFKVCGKPLLGHLIERLKRARRLDDIVVATSENKSDDPISKLASDMNVGCYRGSEHDVLNRVLSAAITFNADTIVEITGDCPALDPQVVDRCVDAFIQKGVDYVANRSEPSYPGGMDVRVFPTKILKEVEVISRDDKAAREHVSLPITESPEKYKIYYLKAPPEFQMPELKVELDEKNDYKMIKKLFEALYPIKPEFSLEDIISYVKNHPEILEINCDVKRKKARE